MKKNKIIIGTAMLAGLTVGAGLANHIEPPKVEAARVDMIDLSNHNGSFTLAEFQSMRNNYGVKAITTKISEGNYYADPYAAGNIKTSQQAGLYINDYFFCRYTDVASAKAEADKLTNENAVILLDEYEQQIKAMYQALDEYDGELSGTDATIYDDLMEKLEQAQK